MAKLSFRLNPRVLAVDSPPIPEAQGWKAAYDGRLGAMIDLSQAVPGTIEIDDESGRIGGHAAVVAHEQLLSRLKMLVCGQEFNVRLGQFRIRLAGLDHVGFSQIIQLASPVGMACRFEGCRPFPGLCTAGKRVNR